MMALRDTLVYDSENWSTYQPFPVVSLFLFGVKLYRSCHILVKGVSTRALFEQDYQRLRPGSHILIAVLRFSHWPDMIYLGEKHFL